MSTSCRQDALSGFAMLAHTNGVNNPYAFFQNAHQPGILCHGRTCRATRSTCIDAATYADGAAALILTRRDLLPNDFTHPVISVIGSGASSDTLALARPAGANGVQGGRQARLQMLPCRRASCPGR